MSTAPDDEPQPMAMTLVVPFVVCASNGGPYDDESFAAGFQAGVVDRMLAVALGVGAERVSVPFAVRTALVRQLELIGMHRYFPIVEVAEIEESPDYPAMPEWSLVTFSTREDDDG